MNNAWVQERDLGKGHPRLLELGSGRAAAAWYGPETGSRYSITSGPCFVALELKACYIYPLSGVLTHA